MQLQKGVKSNPKQPSCKKRVRPQKGHCEKAPNFFWLSLLKILPLAYYHHSHFLGWISLLFSQWHFWGCTLFLQLGYFGLDIIPCDGRSVTISSLIPAGSAYVSVPISPYMIAPKLTTPSKNVSVCLPTGSCSIPE